ncbi:sulfite exporter TauE/SafE family protein [Paraherbaspirillum soli]|uniref:Probable membrane transporter protein n=1 Tax=Paraherbaspirillum soli TaxID=631222 RepID=A0ABW0M964_9BURK
MIVGIFFGTAIGVVLGLTGAGGGILAVPALVLGLGFSMTEATPVALMAVGCAAMLGAIDGLRKGLVRYKAALLMAALGALFSPLGVRIAHQVSERWLMTLFSAVMLIVAWRMANQANSHQQPNASPEYLEKNCMLNPATGKLRWNLKCCTTLATIGTVSGMFTGMLGVGGGFLIVPACRQFSNVSMHGIVATSLMVIALISGSAVAGALLHGVRIPLIGWTFIGAALIGMLLGRLAAPTLPARILQIGFASIATVVALILIGKTYFNGML